jgi:hypothetical protein
VCILFLLGFFLVDTFLNLNAGNTATTNIIIPYGTLAAGSAVAGVAQLGVAPVGPVLSTAVGAGAVAFQRPDGKFVLINGNNTNGTQLLDLGWNADGQYTSEQMKVSPLSANSILEWKRRLVSATRSFTV